MDQSRRPDHVALREIDALARVMNSKIHDDVHVYTPIGCAELRSKADFHNLTYDLIVFGPGDMQPSVKSAMKTARRVVYVLPDINWSTPESLGRDYILVTQLRELDGVSGETAIEKIRALAPQVKLNPHEAVRHVYLPFAELPFLDRHYMQSFIDSYALQPWVCRNDSERADAAYVGSLKTSRADVMARLAAEGDADLYGNFSYHDLCAAAPTLSGLANKYHVNPRAAIRGAVPAASAWRVYAQHGCAIDIADTAPVLLGSDKLRYFEYALAESRVVVEGSDERAREIAQDRIDNTLIGLNGRASLRQYKAALGRQLIPRLQEVVNKDGVIT